MSVVPPMISVSIMVNGDVAYRCSICDKTTYVEIRLSHTPFWGEYNGDALLAMLSHYQEHNS